MNKFLLASLTSAATVFVMVNPVAAQTAITQVYTSYDGYWTSKTDSINTLKPDNSHNLLGFRYDNTVYATGVANAVLTSQNVAFANVQFEALQMPSDALPAGTAAVLGVGADYGGAGNVSPIPVNSSFAEYLYDGVQGLDLGTAIFNYPSSNIQYAVTNFNFNAIGDNVPDLLVTQVGQPPTANSLDSFRFVNAAGATVGNAVSVGLLGIDVVGNGIWKFYNTSSPITFNSLLGGDRPLRIVGFKLSEFGLNAGNIASVTGFVHKLSGQSDQAFTAFNTASFQAGTGVVLPIVLRSFRAVPAKEAVSLNWEIADADNFDYFQLERSTTGTADFKDLARVPFSEKQSGYSYTDGKPEQGQNFYRLQLIDLDGKFKYSEVVGVNFSKGSTNGLIAYPNPVSSCFMLKNATGVPVVTDISGKQLNVPVKQTTEGLLFDSSTLPVGQYMITITNGAEQQSVKISVQH